MKLKFIKTLIILNVLILLISFTIIYFRYSQIIYKDKKSEELKLYKENISYTEESNNQIQSENVQKDTLQTVTTDTKKSELTQNHLRKPKFVFFSSKAKSVSIIGDFNGWVPSPMKKVGPSKWELVLEIPEGRYLYNFLVDNQVKLDPNNKKFSENKQQGFQSSILELK